MNYGNAQGVVTPIDDVVTAATGIKKRSRGQRLFLAAVKDSFQTQQSGQDAVLDGQIL